MKHIILLLFFISSLHLSAQNTQTYQKPPIFPECADQSTSNLKVCFQSRFNSFIFNNFKIPSVVTEDNYKGAIKLLFEVNKEGVFQLIYVDAAYDELKTETQRVFDALPKIAPASYNGKATFVQYSTTINIPLKPITETEQSVEIVEKPKKERVKDPNLNAVISNELDELNASLQSYEQLEYSSQLNIPFTHTYYARFDANLNAIGTNSHTAAKPFLFDDVSAYYDFKAEKENLTKKVKSWTGRKLWNEHLVAVQGKDYWFTIDPIFDLQVGKDTEADFNTTFNNTRGLYVQAGLGKKFNFTASVYESQGRFAQYFNEFTESLRPFGPDPGIVPGRGIAKRFKDDAFDYPVAEAYLSYTPNKVLNVQFGHGKNFIGDGYRSLFLSDVASPYPFLKTNLKFWKIKYTSTWLFLRDVRPEVVEDGAFLPKYTANHYLSWNVSKRLNIGLFESVVWNNANDRGFDVNYLNPFIIFRAIEFETGQDAGNAVVGLSAKYKYNNKINLYSQFIIDEFSISDVRAGNQSFRNKFGFQLGAKYFNAFNVDGLLLQAEYNQVRPYTFSHNSIILNLGHNNQPLAHLWGANFREFILIGRYNHNRWFADGKLIFGERGLDFNTEEDSFAYGGDIFTSENNRPSDNGIRIGQGNNTTVFHGELQAGYVINPVSNLKLFTNIVYRNFDPTQETSPISRRSNTVWFNIGLRTDLFNWYNDF